MIHFTVFITATVLCLAAAGIVSWDLWPLIEPRLAAFHAETLAEARARHDLMLRARTVRTASPEGTAPAPAAGAVPATRGAVPIADTAAQDAVRAELLARPRASYALGPVPSWAKDGANPYPADTRTDMPAVEDRPRVHPLYQAWEREQAARRRLP